KTLTATGIINISAYPKAAKVYINGQLKGVTDINLTLPPGKYSIEIKKDGYTSWSKDVVLKGELVEVIDVLLFPTNPSLSPLTNLGISKAVPVKDSNKIILFSDNDDKEKDGIYVFEPNRPLPIFVPLKLLVLKKFLPEAVDFKTVKVYFSPDLKEALFNFPLKGFGQPEIAYLFSLDEENQPLFDVTNSKKTLLAAWEEENQKKIIKILETFPKEIKKVASDSFQIVDFSPDEQKILYQVKYPVTLPLAITPPLIASNQTPEERFLKTNTLYVYDKKEDKNFKIEKLSSEKRLNWSWYYDSKHLIVNEDGENKKISVVDYDGLNRQPIYSGPLEGSFFMITTDGKLIILANLNPEANKLPDLYLVGIK
ncbi:MAG: PEGA domain-containing protein, partial [Microgenomates group bacterium]|nr:PEGA domain-containing protein [Microgenomates group bacterium]